MSIYENSELKTVMGGSQQDEEGERKVPTSSPYMILLSLALSGAHLAYYMAIFNPMSYPLFGLVYGMSEDERMELVGTLFMAFALGGLLGAVAAGKMIEKLGRWWTLVLVDSLTIVLILLYGIQSKAVLLIIRPISGFCGGCNALASAVMMEELLPKRISATGNAVTGAIMNAVIFVAFIQQNVLTTDDLVEYWRVVLCWPVLINAFKLVTFLIFVRTDTAKYYISKHHADLNLDEKLSEIMMTTHRRNEIQPAVIECKKAHKLTHQAGGGKRPGFAKLFRKDNRRRILAATTIGVAQQAVGIAMFTLYSTDLFGRLTDHGKLVTFLIACSKMVGGVAGVLTMKFFRRKVNALAGLLLQIGSLLGICLAVRYSLNEVVYVLVFLFVFAYSTGLGAIFYPFLAEVQGPIGASFAGGAMGIATAVVSKAIPYMFKYLGDVSTIFFFACLGIFFWFLINCFMIETKDKPESQFVVEYQTAAYSCWNFK